MSRRPVARGRVPTIPLGIGVATVKARGIAPSSDWKSIHVPWLFLLAIGGSWGGAAAADRAPNIVLIVADDLGWGDVGFNGRTEWTTPSLDRLAARGIALKRCYSAAPICGPSRGALPDREIHDSHGRAPQRSGFAHRGGDDRRSHSGAEDTKARSSVNGRAASLAPGSRIRSSLWTRASTSSSATPTRSMLRASFPSSSGKAAIAFRSRGTSTISSRTRASTS